jgi:ribosomal protein S18 acetylase RimI-like enzyme
MGRGGDPRDGPHGSCSWGRRGAVPAASAGRKPERESWDRSDGDPRRPGDHRGRSGAGLDARDEQVRASGSLSDESTLHDRLSTGELRMAVAFAPESPELGPVGGGSSVPVGEVAEIVGVGVLPAYRRRGLAGQLTFVLASDALQRAVRTVFCSAQSAEVARVYETVGFRRIGTACIASVAE